jgi:hypothetical protein
MAVETPHFGLPFTLRASGATVVEQDSVDDVANCCTVILMTPIGSRDLAPELGVQDLTFRHRPVLAGHIESLVATQEPRAKLLIHERTDEYDRFIERITVGISLTREGAVV